MNKQIVIGNLLISYNETAGEGGSAKTLLFLHGWRSDREVWAKIVSQLSAVSCQLIAMDLPGFGQSQVPSRPMAVGDYANIVAEFIKKLELKNVVIVGHSFGGRVGIKLSSVYPELISKLVLVDSAGFPMPAGKKSLMRIVAKIVKPIFRPRMMQGLRKKIYRQIGAEDYLATPELQKTFVSITSEDLSADLKKIQAPTLIINGENDKDTPVEFGQRMNFLIPNSKLQILKNAGHFSFLDQPGEFVAMLKSFIV
jgi:pimeloyl-ACP methyl ester carboxylesterase